ncbi:uncharacterized protein [Physcomitrium patens]|nr:uncharacterized protein LOC112277799 isoform X2 [Physcomitrium patens]|eukprot:XP_024366299.1 uncharacterized protein LOC112277799 isoform X2 [Physcomitrella patens]
MAPFRWSHWNLQGSQRSVALKQRKPEHGLLRYSAIQATRDCFLSKSSPQQEVVNGWNVSSQTRMPSRLSYGRLRKVAVRLRSSALRDVPSPNHTQIICAPILTVAAKGITTRSQGIHKQGPKVSNGIASFQIHVG